MRKKFSGFAVDLVQPDLANGAQFQVQIKAIIDLFLKFVLGIARRSQDPVALQRIRLSFECLSQFAASVYHTSRAVTKISICGRAHIPRACSNPGCVFKKVTTLFSYYYMYVTKNHERRGT